MNIRVERDDPMQNLGRYPLFFITGTPFYMRKIIIFVNHNANNRCYTGGLTIDEVERL